MFNYILRRLLLLPVTLFFIVFVNFDFVFGVVLQFYFEFITPTTTMRTAALIGSALCQKI
mgnify:CR=1 FL=1